MSRAAANHIEAQLRRRPDALLILASGDTPTLAYELLAGRGRAEPGLCDRMRLLKLDEWAGLAGDDPATCEMALRQVLVDPLQIGPDRFAGWDSRPADIPAECGRIGRWLADHGPADLCVLGLGLNGHLGFNEPGDYLQPGPHLAELSATSKGHSMLSRTRGQPRHGLSLGIRDILLSREVLLMVSGARKRSQLRRLLRPEISPRFPASFLWLHPAVTICCDASSYPDGPSGA
jgi:galactosamine-6-phosphate isomerase